MGRGYLNVLVCIEIWEEGISMCLFVLRDGRGKSLCFSLYWKMGGGYLYVLVCIERWEEGISMF